MNCCPYRVFLRLQAASHEADSARKSIEEIEGRFETVRKARKERPKHGFR